MKRHLTIVRNKWKSLPITLSLVAAFFIFTSNYLIAQETTVSGTVTGDNGPLNGVSVTVKGSTRGTSTNSSGRFTILAPSNATLVFSSVGYTSNEVAFVG